MRYFYLLLVIVLAPLAILPHAALGQSGEVRVPLPEYTNMLNKLAEVPRPAPAAFAIGQSKVAIAIRDDDDRISATVTVTLLIETFEDEWTLVPLLPLGAALNGATVDGRPVQLVQGPTGLAWSTDKAGTTEMRLSYGIDARRSKAGFVLPVPVPVAAATSLDVRFPATGIDLAVVPSADLRSMEAEGATRVAASVPPTSSILVSWRMPTKRSYAISRAAYEGSLSEDSVVWTARYQVEVFGGQQITLPLMASTIALSDIRVDGEPATVLAEDGRFATILQGRGMHDVVVAFQVPVIGKNGRPLARLQIPRIPVSRFDLALPGKKDVKVAPGANVATTEQDGRTNATVFVPMTDSVEFTWTEAIPDDLQAQVRANASLYHAIHAEEGVLHGRGTVVYEFTRGKTNLLELEVPEDAQVNRIEAPAGGVTDWSVAPSDRPGFKTISVFLELAVSGEYLLDVAYERLLGAGSSAGQSIAVPLLSAINVHRQRGMVALLSGPELTLEPVTETGVTRVGENQLPAGVRDRIAMTVAHTYKYIDPSPNLLVRAVAPERRQGKFDAQVDTLISLGEVTMKGAATVEIDVKSGAIEDLTLALPDNVNILGVTGPSLRSHQEREGDGNQSIEIAFTRPMEGQFRIEVNYERIMENDAGESVVPAISVPAAEVEHGRIAVEALTAAEVKALTADRLSTVDVNELPQQLVLKTTNPILLAYRYVHAKPPFKLALKITRHKEIDVQVAAIERANYSSLITRDGLAVTTARLTVRNSSRQFLRLALPAGSRVWSVFVDGNPEKPAYAREESADRESSILVKMINSSEGFPVDIVYATPVAAIDYLGSVSSRLPRPDMVVTHTRWDVFMPIGPRYQTPDSSMDVVVDGAFANPRAFRAEAAAQPSGANPARMGQPLRINVPAQGIRFGFEKLYANQSADDAAFTIHYASKDANSIGLLISAAGVVLLWIGIVAIGYRRIALPRNAIMASIGLGVLLLGATIGYLGTSPAPASGLALAIAVVLAAWWAVGRLRAWRATRLIG